MHEELLNHTPIGYYCPVCKKMHPYKPIDKRTLNYRYRGHQKSIDGDMLKCPDSDAIVVVGVNDGKVIYASNDLCNTWRILYTHVIDPNDFIKKNGKPVVTYTLKPEDYAGDGTSGCDDCGSRANDAKCLYSRTVATGYNVAFEYDEYEFDVIERTRKERKEEMERNKRRATSTSTNASNDNKMKLWTKLYEQSPKQNIHEAWDWMKAHESTFKWAVPVVSIYVAYKILNTEKCKITIDNVNEIAKQKLGFSLDSLQNKKALMKLMDVGGVCAAAYATYNFFNKGKNPDDVEATMEALERVSQENRFLGKQAEKLLPVATSVIIVYLMTQQPKWLPSKDQVTEVISFVPKKVRTYGGVILGEVAERFGIDTEDEEQMHKVRIFAFLGIVVAGAVLFYGVKMIKKKDEAKFTKMEENMKAFVKQILAIMKALLPTAFSSVATILVTRKVLEMTDVEEMEAAEVETISADEVTVE